MKIADELRECEPSELRETADRACDALDAAEKALAFYAEKSARPQQAQAALAKLRGEG